MFKVALIQTIYISFQTTAVVFVSGDRLRLTVLGYVQMKAVVERVSVPATPIRPAERDSRRRKTGRQWTAQLMTRAVSG